MAFSLEVVSVDDEAREVSLHITLKDFELHALAPQEPLKVWASPWHYNGLSSSLNSLNRHRPLDCGTCSSVIVPNQHNSCFFSLTKAELTACSLRAVSLSYSRRTWSFHTIRRNYYLAQGAESYRHHFRWIVVVSDRNVIESSQRKAACPQEQAQLHSCVVELVPFI